MKKMHLFPQFFIDTENLIARPDVTLTGRDVRALVGWYFQFQDYRESAAHQVRTSGDDPAFALKSLGNTFRALEDQTKALIEQWAKRDVLCRWPLQVKGIGGILAAGLAAHIDMTRAHHPSSVWRFCGYDPSVTWIGRKGARKIADEYEEKYEKPEKAIEEAALRVGQSAETIRKFSLEYGEGKHTWASFAKAISRCPWNAKLKVHCYKIGDSFVKLSTNPGSFYGLKYSTTKTMLVERNETGFFAEKATGLLASGKRWSALQRAAYKKGRLTAGHIDKMARRATVKLFLSHWWEAAYIELNGKQPPAPWIIAHGGHVDVISAADVLAFERNASNGGEGREGEVLAGGAGLSDIPQGDDGCEAISGDALLEAVEGR